MIDTHCHLLPALDDGPRREEEAVELAAALSAGGVQHVVCTPHYSRRYRTSHEKALVAADALRVSLAGAGIPLRLQVAAEFSPILALEAPAVDLRVRSIGRRFLLVELGASTAVPVIEAVCDRLQSFGLLPIFAHPERCAGVQRHPESLDASRARGAMIQVVASSVLGRWGSAAAETAWRLLAADRVDLLASDAHRARSAGGLESTAKLVASRLGRRIAHRLTVDNPSRVLQGTSLGEQE